MTIAQSLIQTYPDNRDLKEAAFARSTSATFERPNMTRYNFEDGSWLRLYLDSRGLSFIDGASRW